MRIIYNLKKIARYLLSNKNIVLKHYGNENPDKTFFLVHPEGSGVGLFAYVTIITGHIDYALKKGYIPIVDMKNYDNTYLDENTLGKENAWEYFFKQPSQYSLEDVYSSKNVIISHGAPYCWPDASVDFCFDKKLRKYWKNIVDKYVVLNDDLNQMVEDQWNTLFTSEDKILGVKCRGTDYLKLKPKWHPRQPEPEEVIKKARQVMKEQGCNKIFLSTEDKNIYEMFKKEFGDIVVTNDQMRYDYDGKQYISVMKSDRENDAYLQGIEYLVTTLILAKCDCFIGGRNGGTVGALLFSPGYKYEYIWNLGRYF